MTRKIWAGTAALFALLCGACESPPVGLDGVEPPSKRHASARPLVPGSCHPVEDTEAHYERGPEVPPGDFAPLTLVVD